MRLKTTDIIVYGLIAMVLVGSTFQDRLLDKLSQFIPSVEGFRAHPYWDVSRYSWGYGTAAPGATGTITRAQAFADMVAHLMGDYATLSHRITRALNVNQWAALLSFSYNTGIGNALNLVANINSGDDNALFTQMRKYVHAGGEVIDDLVTRREKEISLWVA